MGIEETVELELDRHDVICLVKGSHVPHPLMEDTMIRKLGSHNGSYGRWDWKWHFSKGSKVNSTL